MTKLFKDMELSSNVLQSIEKLGYEKPSEIQEMLIPVVLSGKDAIGEAQTGTGKTLAFAASILSNLNKEKRGIKAMILSPTRELAVQIAKEFHELDINKEYDAVAVYGGSDIRKQINMLRMEPDIVIGTPGRVKDLINRKRLNLTKIDYFVLDEADEMLNMGFIKDIEEIVYNTSRDKQVLMLSATMSREIKMLIEKYMRPDFEHIKVESDSKTKASIEQNNYVISSKTKLETLCRIVDSKNIKKAIIFAKTKRDCDELVEEMQGRNYDVDVIHGDVSQGQRIRTLERFKKGEFKYLIATDVAARGIHVDNIELVINYSIPFDKESYIHRIGRTGRAGTSGEAINLITAKERDFMRRIEKFANCKMNEKNVPSKEEIMNTKYAEMIENIKPVLEEDKLEKEIEFIRDFNKADLIKFSAALLQYNVKKSVGSDFNKEVVVKERKVREINENQQRVFINVGKKDSLRKSSLVEFLTEEGNVKNSDLDNIELLETFTFVDVNKEVVDTLISTLSGKEYNGRVVNIEISNKKTRSPRSGGRGGNFRSDRSGSRDRRDSGSRGYDRNNSRDRRDSGSRSYSRDRDNNRGSSDRNYKRR